MLKELNPLLHSQLRLAVMSILLSVDRLYRGGKKFCGQEASYRLPDDLNRAGGYG